MTLYTCRLKREMLIRLVSRFGRVLTSKLARVLLNRLVWALLGLGLLNVKIVSYVNVERWSLSSSTFRECRYAVEVVSVKKTLGKGKNPTL